MAVERFTKQEFEEVLPEARMVGTYGREFVYDVETSHLGVVVRIHSSVSVLTNRADVTGENSIRCYLYRRDQGRSLGKDGTDYTTRVLGWQKRLREKIEVLKARVRPCYRCAG